MLRACLALAMFALPAGAHDLPVPGGGTLTLSLPPEWREVHRHTPKDLPPTIAFECGGPIRGSLQITALWSLRQEPGFASAEKIREICLAGQAALKGGTREAELPLRPLQGAHGAGFLYDATDKSYAAPAGKPQPGEYPVLTHGELGLDTLILGFTIMSDAKGDAAVREALVAVQNTGLRPGALTRVQGAGLDLLLDLDGFKQELGVQHFHGAYYQLGFYTSDALHLNVSILVDELGGKGLADLEKAGIGQSKGAAKLVAGGKVRSEPVDQPKGFLISYPAEFPMKDYIMAQWYFETIHQGKWLELHFSRVLKAGEDTQATHVEVLRVVRSIQAAK